MIESFAALLKLSLLRKTCAVVIVNIREANEKLSFVDLSGRGKKSSGVSDNTKTGSLNH